MIHNMLDICRMPLDFGRQEKGAAPFPFGESAALLKMGENQMEEGTFCKQRAANGDMRDQEGQAAQDRGVEAFEG